jgi:hypothetical protein
MPLGYGWWLDLKSGKAIEIDEHAHFVKGNPKLFGINPKDVENLMPGFGAKDVDRRKILLMTMARGFARIRVHGIEGMIEFDWANIDDAMFEIVKFFDENFSPNTHLEIHDLYRKKQYEGRLETFLSPEGLAKTVGVMESDKLSKLLKHLLQT